MINRMSHVIVKYRRVILILCVLLLIPSILGMIHTRINYDMLTYLPEELETVKGQDILLRDFGKGAFSLVIVEGMRPNEVAALTRQLEGIDHVASVLSYAGMTDGTIPMELLPEKYYDVLNSGDATLVAIFFDAATSADETMQAIGEVKAVAKENCYVTGMSALVTELKELCEAEEPIYVGLAVLLAVAAMMIFMDSWLIPFVFLLSIGMAILLNLGSNYFLGEISYITKALSAVLQLAVTMDYSIFLWNSYCEQKRLQPDDKQAAMADAISETFVSVLGSSVTTVAGFLALCFMSFTLGRDLGFVMAKGVIFGVIGCVTTLPALILLLDKPLEKSRHKPLLPKMEHLAGWIVKRYRVFLILFAVLLVPALFGYRNAKVYYDMGQSLPQDMDVVIANTKLRDDFDMASTHMLLADSALPAKDTADVMAELKQVDGVKAVLGLRSVLGSSVPEELVPERLLKTLKSGNYQLILVSSEYAVASDAVNEQVDELNGILKAYDPDGMLIGEAPCTKDMITITDHDFQIVDAISIAAIFVIILLVLRSVSLPVILVAVIEFAIFINLGIPYYTGAQLPFVAPICISTIQLGATVDYAILLTTKYKKERAAGQEKQPAVKTALASAMPSIMVSALGFFAATFGVAVYSNIDIISSMCSLMARGALVSMLSVMTVLPALFLLCDGLIMKTSLERRKAAKTEVRP